MRSDEPDVLVRPRASWSSTCCPVPEADAGPEGTAPHVRRPPRRQRPERGGRRRPAGRPGPAAGAAGHRPARRRTCAGTPSSPASTSRGFVDADGAGEPRRRRPAPPTAPPTTASTCSAPPTGSGPTRNCAASCPSGTGDPARRVDLQLDRAGLPRPSRGWSSGCTGDGVLISVDPNIRPMLADGPRRRRRSATPRRSSATGWTGWSRGPTS